MKKKMMIINIAIIVFVTLLLVFYLFFVDGFDNFINAFKNASLIPMLTAFLMIIVYWILESLTVYVMAKKVYPPHQLKNSIKTVMIGQLFNSITPFATGGQPMQAFVLCQRGMPAGLATFSLFSRFIVYQIVLTIFSIIALIFRLNFFVSHISSLGYIVLIGFLVNFAVVAGLLMIAFFRNGTKKVAKALIVLLHKTKIVKSQEELIQKTNDQIDLFYENMCELKKYTGVIIKMVILTAFQLIAYFSIPYFICISLGAEDLSLFNVLCSSSFVLMISSFVPLPGAALGAEGSFLLFFSMYFTDSEYISTAMLIWRFITFYLPIIFGVMFLNRLHKIENITLTSEGNE
ncbi:MAG: flippase-like domain-containing protein [Clostridia bacterium]|nr:flippase-like domain-containing protein [Clostridia bacterium]